MPPIAGPEGHEVVGDAAAERDRLEELAHLGGARQFVRGGGKRAGVFTPRRERALWDVWSLSWLDVAPLVPVAMFCPNSRHDEVVVRLGGVVAWWLKTNPRPNGPDREPIALRGFAELAGRECKAYNGDSLNHPCEKPLTLMRWLVSATPADALVLDPFCGSGTTGVACLLESRRFLGIERDADYCAIARRRIAEAVSQGNLFETAKANA